MQLYLQVQGFPEPWAVKSRGREKSRAQTLACLPAEGAPAGPAREKGPALRQARDQSRAGIRSCPEAGHQGRDRPIGLGGGEHWVPSGAGCPTSDIRATMPNHLRGSRCFGGLPLAPAFGP